MEIKLGNKGRVPKGNFGFVYEKTKDQEIFDLLLACESVYRLDYRDFAHKLRMAYEAIAIWCEMKYLKEHRRAKGMSDEELKREITRNAANPHILMRVGDQKDQPYHFKNMLIRYTYDFSEQFESFLHRFSYDTRKSLQKNLVFWIRYFYDFGSKSSHVGTNDAGRFQLDQRNVRMIFHAFHDFLTVLFSVSHTFSEQDVPIRDFYPVPESICHAQGLELEKRERLYLREEHGKIRYYLGILENNAASLKDRRERDAVRQLWEETCESPSNIIRSADLLPAAEEGEVYQFYALADFPMSLRYTLLRDMSQKERRRLVQGIARGIFSMHRCNPPVYHRNLCPEVFLLFKLQGQYQILLADFQYSKCQEDFVNSQDSEGAETVFFDLKKMASRLFENDFFAPEIRGKSGQDDSIDWEKADVFSFGQLWLYMMTGFVLEKPEETYHLINRADLRIEEKDLLADMLSWDAQDRPGMKTVMRVLTAELI